MSGDELPDFVWQHKYHNWITYFHGEDSILNKAVNKWQKTVTLPSTDAKKKLVVHLDKMLQVNTVSGVEQQVRCLIYNDRFYTWSWEDDDGTWKSFHPRILCFLEIAYQRKETVFRFYDEGDYKIDLLSRYQINEETNFKRKVNREQVTAHPFNFRFVYNEQKFKQMCTDSSVSLKKRFINLPSLTPLRISMGASASREISMPDVTETDEEEYDPVLPVDAECVEGKDYHIYLEDGLPFSSTLSCVSILENKNKFHLIQLLQHNKKKKFAVWQKYGRVGTKGHGEFQNFNSVLQKAKEEFMDIFYEKTGNLWQNKEHFTCLSGKYDLLKVDLNPQSDIVLGEIDLDPPIKSLLEFICNKEIMSVIMSEMCYDSTNAPLGQLTFEQIKDGYKALGKIVEALSSETAGSDLVNACEEFYMKIPHNFGKKSPPILQSTQDVEKKMEMLKALNSIRVAMKVLNRGVHEHPLNRCYDSFKYNLEELDSSREEFSVLQNCLHQTQGATHCYKMEITNIYSCSPKANSSFKNYGNNRLLWHGSRLTNWVGILKNGLKIAPSEAPSTGYAFGKGLYFADISSKSANYCFPTKKSSEGLLLLCEVSLGNQFYLLEGDETLHFSLPQNYNSVFGKGKFIPKSFDLGILSSEARLPSGPLIKDSAITGTLQYNEYVVYDVNQVEMKYLLKIKFHLN